MDGAPKAEGVIIKEEENNFRPHWGKPPIPTADEIPLKDLKKPRMHRGPHTGEKWEKNRIKWEDY